ncbi:MAG: hypothetical protein K2K72_07365, partial [Duncaniella sp.]|nr:hypothetical protein [Duncaniella sp.]
HYTPPPHASALHRAGGLLPAWWGEADDAVLVADDSYLTDAEWLAEHWGVTCHPVTSAPAGFIPSPWGWSRDAARQFAASGVSPQLLPDADTLNLYRSLSHRRSSIAILRALGVDPSEMPREFTDAAEAVRAEQERPGCYFKSPWSSSGRGVFCAEGLGAKALYDRAEGIIHRQGSVIVEPGLHKLLDLAALFHADCSGAVSYRGLSVFTTDISGNYGGNLVAPQPALRDMIDRYGLLGEYDRRCTQLVPILADLTRGYSGPLGVDMMIHSDTKGHPALHPCIELNLRTTMGIAAMGIAARTGSATPRLVTWQLSDRASRGELLLPSRSGFSLMLLPFHPHS